MRPPLVFLVLSGGSALLTASCVGSELDTRPRLEREVRLAAARQVPEAKVSVWLSRVDGREVLALEADRRVAAASTIKVLILVEAHAQALEGTFRWTEEVALRDEDRAGGSGSLQREKTGSTWSYVSLARRMIAESDNTASNLLLRRLGMEKVNARAVRLGMAVTRFERYFMDGDARRAGRENWTTAREMGELLRAIYRREVLTPAACDEMIATLERTSRGRIAAGVPRDVPVGHKGGSLPGLRHDVGWVRLPGQPYVLSVFLDNVLERPGSDEDRGVSAIEAVAGVVYAAMGPSDQ
jgi:beta-lactamase class A